MISAGKVLTFCSHYENLMMGMNRYRLVAKINFRGQIVAVRDVMTHVEL